MTRVTAKDYAGGLHPFISSPNPELSASMTQAEKDEFITDEQKELSGQAESDIRDWVDHFRHGV